MNLIQRLALYSSLILFGFLPVSLSSQNLSAPQFSHERGFYTEAFTLSISTDLVDAVIYYTLDGTDPDQNSQVFNTPIEIDSRTGDENVFSEIPTNNISAGHQYREDWRSPQGEVFKLTIIRARLYTDTDSSRIVTHTFLVDENGSERYSMPLFSLVTNPENWFSDESGIYVAGNNDNYNQRGADWERPVHIEFFENDGSVAIAQDGGVRIHGGTSRNRPRKTLRLYARSDYGESWFEYPIFPDKDVSRYKRILLRNSGNDWSESLFRDAYLQSLIKENTELDMQYSRPAIVFINGEYWGIHNIRDRFDDRYLQAHYSVDPDRVSILENRWEYDDGDEAGVDDFNDFMQFVNLSNTALPSNYEIIKQRIDVENFIDYQITQIFSRNTDWPGNNVRFWRYMNDGYNPEAPYRADGLWRWMVFDLDFGFGLQFDYVNNSQEFGGNNPFHNTLSFALKSDGSSWPNPEWSTRLFRRLMVNSDFKKDFISRFADHLNTTFSQNRIVAQLDSLTSLYTPEMNEHILRWSEPTMSHWESDLNIMHDFAMNRTESVRENLDNYFNLGGTENLTVDVDDTEAGFVKVNSMIISSKRAGVPENVYPWVGSYFKNVPVRLIAVPNAGYEFSGWSGTVTSENDTIIVDMNDAASLIAHFIEGEFNGDELNPIAFVLSEGMYEFTYWDENEPEGSFPDHMVFLQSSVNDPGLTAEMTHPYYIPFIDENDNEYHANDQDKFGFPYKLTGRTRIEALGDDGIAMINTGRGRDLGAVVLALDTRDVSSARIQWDAQTIQANSRTYNIRLQYRIGIHSEWQDVIMNEDIVEYTRNSDTEEVSTFSHDIGGVFMGQPYIQFRWKYYYTGVRLTQESGQRDMLRLDNIRINALGLSTESIAKPNQFELFQNYPNPFNPSSIIRFQLNQNSNITLEVFDMIGRRVATLASGMMATGEHQVKFDGAGLSSGIYMYKLTANGQSEVRRMTLIK